MSCWRGARCGSATLAERVGITPQNLSVLKTGRARAIRFSTLEKLCEALECQPRRSARISRRCGACAPRPMKKSSSSRPRVAELARETRRHSRRCRRRRCTDGAEHAREAHGAESGASAAPARAASPFKTFASRRCASGRSRLRVRSTAKQRPGRTSASSMSPMFGRFVVKMIFRPSARTTPSATQRNGAACRCRRSAASGGDRRPLRRARRGCP